VPTLEHNAIVEMFRESPELQAAIVALERLDREHGAV